MIALHPTVGMAVIGGNRTAADLLPVLAENHWRLVWCAQLRTVVFMETRK